jgi:hypothetical protein
VCGMDALSLKCVVRPQQAGQADQGSEPGMVPDAEPFLPADGVRKGEIRCVG